MSIEKQLERIQSKAKLLKSIDKLPDEASGVVLLRYDAGGNREHIQFFYVGDISFERANYLIDTFKAYLFKDME
jgi:hypothetical protein